MSITGDQIFCMYVELIMTDDLSWQVVMTIVVAFILEAFLFRIQYHQQKTEQGEQENEATNPVCELAQATLILAVPSLKILISYTDYEVLELLVQLANVGFTNSIIS